MTVNKLKIIEDIYRYAINDTFQILNGYSKSMFSKEDLCDIASDIRKALELNGESYANFHNTYCYVNDGKIVYNVVYYNNRDIDFVIYKKDGNIVYISTPIKSMKEFDENTKALVLHILHSYFDKYKKSLQLSDSIIKILEYELLNRILDNCSSNIKDLESLRLFLSDKFGI